VAPRGTTADKQGDRRPIRLHPAREAGHDGKNRPVLAR
jgi:hypothetical protein